MSKFKPGCFGIPSVFSLKSKTCGACGSFDACRAQAHSELHDALALGGKAVRDLLFEYERACHDSDGAKRAINSGAPAKPRDKRAKYQRFELTERQQMRVATAQKNVAKRLETLYRKGYDALIRRAIRAKDFAFSEIANQRSLRLALQMLVSGELSRKAMRVAFSGTLGWSELSAQSEATIMWGLLPGLEVAEQRGNSLVLTPELCEDNE